VANVDDDDDDVLLLLLSLSEPGFSGSSQAVGSLSTLGLTLGLSLIVYQVL